MGSQTLTALLTGLWLPLTGACGNAVNPPISSFSAPVDAPDLSLRSVAFARLADQQVVARGTAEQLDYRRSGGRLEATRGTAIVHPSPASRFATYGSFRFVADRVAGEVPTRRGSAWGGVRVDTSRGDTVLTDRLESDGDFLRSVTPVTASGPGYSVRGKGLIARIDGSTIQLTHGVAGQLETEARR
jgi:hypothetical protein